MGRNPTDPFKEALNKWKDEIVESKNIEYIKEFFYKELLFESGSPENGCNDENYQKILSTLYNKIDWPAINGDFCVKYKYCYDQMNPHEDNVKKAIKEKIGYEAVENLEEKIDEYAAIRKTIGNILPIIVPESDGYRSVVAGKGSRKVSRCCDTFEGFVEFLNNEELQKPKDEDDYDYREMAACYKNALIKNREAWFMEDFIKEGENLELTAPYKVECGKDESGENILLLKDEENKTLENIDDWEKWLKSTTNKIKSRTNKIVKELTKELTNEHNDETK